MNMMRAQRIVILEKIFGSNFIRRATIYIDNNYSDSTFYRDDSNLIRVNDTFVAFLDLFYFLKFFLKFEN